MKLRYLNILILLFAASAVQADGYTYSDHKPAIQRLQGCILFPYDIEAISVSDEIDDKATRTAYRYNLLRIEDVGQDIKDRATFVAENAYRMTAQVMQIDAVSKDAVVAAKIAELQTVVETKINTEFTKEMKASEIEAVK